MERQPLYQHIREIADNLVAGSQTMSRADLAFELKEFGLEGDSLQIAEAIYNAYTAFKNYGNIRLAFVDAATGNSIVEDANLFSVLEQGANGVQQLMQSSLSQVEREHNQLSSIVNSILSGQAVKTAATIGQHLAGTSGVVKIQQEAGALYKNYGELVLNYEGYKNNIGNLTQQFVYLRDKVADSYRRRATELIDIFGEDIKAIEPQLFDFDQITWLDTQGMQKKISLEFGNLQQNCAGLLSTISDQFQTAITSSLQSYKAVNHRGIGLAVIGLSIFSHYAQANAQTNELRIELEKFKHLIHVDATTIRTDMLRLFAIYKSLNDVAIPRAIAFMRMAEKILDEDYQQLLTTLYSDNNIHALQKEREQILSAIRQQEDRLVDHRAQIENYQIVLQDHYQELNNRNARYQIALREKPSKSPLFLNLLFLGLLNLGYDQKIYDWKQQYGTIEHEFENLQIDIKLFEEDLSFHKQQLQEGEQKLIHHKVKLESLNRQIRQILNVSPSIKQSVAEKLRDIVALLRLAREIASSKIDERLINATIVQDPEELTLPDNVLQGLSTFTSTLREVSLPSIQDEILNNIQSLDNEDSTISEADQEAFRTQVASTAQSINQLIDSAARLQLLKEQSQISHHDLEQKYATLQNEFRVIIEATDNQSKLLREAFSQMNTAHSPREIKEALYHLSNGQLIVSMKEINDFLSGNGSITL